jgi:hypothetical protein
VAGGYAGIVSGEPDLEIDLARAKSGKFGVGFITWALTQAPKMLTKALHHSPFCVFLSFGGPRPFAAEIHEAECVYVLKDLGGKPHIEAAGLTANASKRFLAAMEEMGYAPDSYETLPLG